MTGEEEDGGMGDEDDAGCPFDYVPATTTRIANDGGRRRRRRRRGGGEGNANDDKVEGASTTMNGGAG